MAKPKTPVRIFEGTTKPYEPFWRVRDAAETDSGEPEFEFYGFISEYSWFGDEITPEKFKNDLNKYGAGGPVTIRINSGGGEVFAASVIRSIIVDYKGKVTVRIDGLCASAATYVAMAGDVVRMQDTAYFMIHDPSAIAWGTVDDLKGVIDLLKTVKSGIMDAYQVKTGIGMDKLSKMMSDETWMSANEAKTLGFVDEVIADKKSAAASVKNVAILNALQNYVNVPAALFESEMVEKPVQLSAEVQRLQAEVKILKKGE